MHAAVPVGVVEHPSGPVPMVAQQPTDAFIVQVSKNALLTLTGLFLESNEMFRSPAGTPGYAVDCSHATNESLNGVQTYSGHSPE